MNSFYNRIVMIIIIYLKMKSPQSINSFPVFEFFSKLDTPKKPLFPVSSEILSRTSAWDTSLFAPSEPKAVITKYRFSIE